MTAPARMAAHHRGALERAIEAFRRQADALGPFNHDAEFPEGDAEALREVVAYIEATEAPNDFVAGWLAGHAAGRAGDAGLVAMLQARIARLESGAELPAAATEALRKVAALNPDASEIGAGMLRTIVQLSRAALAGSDRRVAP